MKDTIINVLTNEVIQIEVPAEEQARRETERLQLEEEAKKPQPPNAEELIEILKQRDAKMQEDISLILEALGG